ncbi:hypothetical protein [Thiopseudomonas denitrificans]|uniref:hypothetical protein n=1 Tax=Thiopseudomonas denitrificans TaxID=1501432 RepID=UPI00105BED99|nr:hypothetical protein [Thiopseudomonas denitrificans]
MSDLHNHSDYKASSAGLVASYDFGIGKDNKAAMAEANQGKAYSSDLTGSAVSRISGSDNSVYRAVGEKSREEFWANKLQTEDSAE